MPLKNQSYLKHLLVVALFACIAVLFFYPVLQGKKIFQSDIVQYIGMSKQQNDFRESTGEETYWTNAAFAGMPTYQLGAKYPHNYIKQVDLALRFLPRPADYLFLYFIGIYALLLVLKVDFKLAFLGALAFGFSTYLIIILGVGHNAKAHAIAYMPLVLSGILLTLKGDLFKGFVLTTVAMALELVANHFQMTYYLLFMVLCLGIVFLIDAVKQQKLMSFVKSISVLCVAVLIALGLNATNLMATSEYAKSSTRGKSELTINPDRTPKDATEGLDYDYITEYSYGKAESLNLLIPNFMGGGSGDPFPEDSEAFSELLKLGASPQDAARIVNQVPLYWGAQPIVAAPAYIGAVVMFLAILALFLIQGKYKKWLIATIILSLLLSWGKNFSGLTNFFIEYVPLYNKFRAVSSIQVLIELALPILAILGLQQLFYGNHSKEKLAKATLNTLIILAGTVLVLIFIGPVLFDFGSPYDSYFRDELGLPFIDAVREDRKSVFKMDAYRTLLFLALVFGTLYLFLKQKIKTIAAISVIAILILIDLGGVDKRYVTSDDFVQARIMDRPFQKTAADIEIEKDPGYFRVYDATSNAFSSGRASYFHNALGGYHAAKPGRIKDLNDFYIEKGDIGILNTLNVKYIITQGPNGSIVAQRNPYANGNAWFVANVLLADSANEELLLLDSLNTKETAVVHKDFMEFLPTKQITRDSLATISLENYAPNALVYSSNSTSDQLAVFSENYYPDGWNAYIDDAPVQHFRVNYTLRGLTIPQGNHTITFKFEPKVVATGSKVALWSSIVFGILFIGGGFLYYKKENTTNEQVKK